MAKAIHSSRVDYDGLGETELVALARAGRRDAFRAIMTRCNQRLFRVARGVVRDEAEAEDVLQEAYARAFAKLESFRGEASILTWLTRITLNEARGRLRKRRSTVDLDQLELAQQEGAQVIIFPTSLNGDGPEADAGRAQVRRLIEHAVDELPEAFRMVFILRDVDECSIEETATTLGIKPETVKTRLFRARRMLRRALDEKLASTMSDAYPFLGARCQRITDRVLARMAPKYGWDD
jgi:RNA polymerase sigma-70 factor (ECF subfamily)